MYEKTLNCPVVPIHINADCVLNQGITKSCLASFAHIGDMGKKRVRGKILSLIDTITK